MRGCCASVTRRLRRWIATIGQLRTRLTELNLRENTVLWYCGDNGTPPSYGRVVTPFRKEKGHVYEGGIRVPGSLSGRRK